MSTMRNASAVADGISGRQAGAPAATRRNAGLETGAPFAGEGARATLPALPLRFSDPLRVLLCWAALLYRAGALDARLLSRAGVSAADLSAFADEHGGALEELRRLRLAGTLFGRRELGALLRARLAEGLMGATRMGEVLALTRALASAPDWAWEEDGSGGGPPPGAEPDAAAGRATGRRPCQEREALADKARAELARLAGEMAGAGATEDVSAAAEWAQMERVASLLDKLDHAALAGGPPRRVRNASYDCGPGRQPSATKAKRKPRR